MLLCAVTLLWQKNASAQNVPLPPLPGEEGTVSLDEAFSILPGPNDIPPQGLAPGEPDPVQPPPVDAGMDKLPDIDPLGLPSDGEPMPNFPDIPGLVLPSQRPALPGGVAPTPSDILPELLPPAELQLAKKTMWYKSPREARKASIAQGKPLLMFFAQLWDGACPTVYLNDDLFSMPEFNEFASARLILTKLQYPVSNSAKSVSEAKKAALQQFRDYFKITGFPVIIMLDETGRELKRIKGYRRINDPQSGQIYSTAHLILDQLKEVEHRQSERRRFQQERIDNLTSQGYRVWTSRKGSTMLGKLVEAKPERIVLKDENGRWRQVLPAQLILFDAEWARRKQAGLIPEAAPEKETAASGAAFSSQP